MNQYNEEDMSTSDSEDDIPTDCPLQQDCVKRAARFHAKAKQAAEEEAKRQKRDMGRVTTYNVLPTERKRRNQTPNIPHTDHKRMKSIEALKRKERGEKRTRQWIWHQDRIQEEMDAAQVSVWVQDDEEETNDPDEEGQPDSIPAPTRDQETKSPTKKRRRQRQGKPNQTQPNSVPTQPKNAKRARNEQGDTQQGETESMPVAKRTRQHTDTLNAARHPRRGEG